MPPRIYLYDRDGNEVNDPERLAEYATGLNWSSLAPKGHASASFQIATSDIAAQWRIKDAYELIIRDGNNILWQGRLRGLNRRIQAGREIITVRADGWYVALADRKLRRRWVDNLVVERLYWDDYQSIDADQNQLLYTKQEGFIIFRAGYSDISRTVDTGIKLTYTMPVGTEINDLDWVVDYRSGEGYRFYVYNVDQATEEDIDPGAEVFIRYIDGTPDTDTGSWTIAEGATSSIKIYVFYEVTDTYDENDWIKLRDVTIRAVMDSFPSPNWYADEMIQDTLEIGAADVISSDYTGLDSPGLAITPFMTLNDGFETLDSICSRLSQFGDSDGDSWYFYVWDEAGASDSLPRAYLTERSTADHEYRVSLAEMNSFENEPDLNEVYNWIIVRYTDAEKYEKFLTPATQSSLKDTGSIAAYDERHLQVEGGQSDSTAALELGQRWLASRKDPIYRGQFEISGWIRNKFDVPMPVTSMRAGQRVFIEDWNGGETWFLREVRIDGDNMTAVCIRDLPPDTLETQLTQQKAGLV